MLSVCLPQQLNYTGGSFGGGAKNSRSLGGCVMDSVTAGRYVGVAAVAHCLFCMCTSCGSIAVSQQFLYMF